MKMLQPLIRFCERFAKDDKGTVTVEFVLVFPMFFGFFLMTYESGMISARHVMLERGVDIAVRDVRIGVLPNPTREQLRQRICDTALIIPNCEQQLEIEMLRRDPTAWVAVPSTVRCVDRGDINADNSDVDTTANNQLMVIRVCVRIDPVLPTTGLGKAIVESNSDSSADGSYALVSMAAFVVEPFKVED
ncbi:TadE/TadG family type IV pilus assembly protein [Loktanella sp. Alg231-35]|uniref:TadE/TadG family type IV pilus assembly protein n=1 Tax=Loktanella sp. Alg231-35 TaxID=1922220 RepID=UPI000D5536E9|nr:TadE/TadG family type IV pilus assembly protein [Loktanella sp. Alg231-35]